MKSGRRVTRIGSRTPPQRRSRPKVQRCRIAPHVLGFPCIKSAHAMTLWPIVLLVALRTRSFASLPSGVESPTVNTSLCETCSRRLIPARSIEGHHQRTSASKSELIPCRTSRERPPQARRVTPRRPDSPSTCRQPASTRGAARGDKRSKRIAHGPPRKGTLRFRAVRSGGFT